MAEAAANAQVLDALNGLLEAEINSVFRYILDASPHLSRATAEIRRPLLELRQLSQKHAHELANLIDALGGVATPRRLARTEDQYLAYLSLKFLLPKLVIDERLIHQRYENAKRAIGPSYPQIIAELDRMLGEQTALMDVLKRAASDATGGRFRDSAGAASGNGNGADVK